MCVDVRRNHPLLPGRKATPKLVFSLRHFAVYADEFVDEHAAERFQIKSIRGVGSLEQFLQLERCRQQSGVLEEQSRCE